VTLVTACRSRKFQDASSSEGRTSVVRSRPETTMFIKMLILLIGFGLLALRDWRAHRAQRV
jgi:hypothetical protein